MQLSTLGIELHRTSAQIRINELREYSKAIETLIDAEAAKVGGELESTASKLEEAEKDEFWAFHSEYYQNYSVHFPEKFRQSLIGLAHSILEREVVSIATFLGKTKKLKITYKDLKGDDFQRAKDFIMKLIELPLDHDAWQPLDHYRKIRNIVTHRDGFFDKDDRSLKATASFINKHPHVKLGHMDQIIPTSEFVLSQADSIEVFLKELFKAWENWLRISGVASK